MVETEEISGDDLLFERRGGVVLITLNRPEALNALSHEMALGMEIRLKAYAEDNDVTAIVVQGAGERAFCAGGDIRRLYDTGRAGEDYPYNFYRDEYRLNALIFHYPKPYIALIDGIDMGGGVGVSVHGSHRVVTERLNFAMPETGIGLFPDVGGSYFLSRLPGEIGCYMALTGARLRAADAVYAGVGDAYVESGRLPELIDALEESGNVEQTLSLLASDPGLSAFEEMRGAIDRTFVGDEVEGILAGLDATDSKWAFETAGIMRTKSPTSLKIALRQIRTGAGLEFDDCMRMEYRIANGCIEGHDFYEGVRAVVIDKDQAPKWQPAGLGEVAHEDIEAYFNRSPRGGDLELG
jgi:enoyl-CoA hydratase